MGFNLLFENYLGNSKLADARTLRVLRFGFWFHADLLIISAIIVTRNFNGNCLIWLLTEFDEFLIIILCCWELLPSPMSFPNFKPFSKAIYQNHQLVTTNTVVNIYPVCFCLIFLTLLVCTSTRNGCRIIIFLY